jgi:hypothetical protein
MRLFSNSKKPHILRLYLACESAMNAVIEVYDAISMQCGMILENLGIEMRCYCKTHGFGSFLK